ncbi:Glutathione S-transferase T3 [Gracilariopsis chorda]|uniref:Glutathione S-transferase T3 n=1 Tax=Gracilariopsis chorda TaxID=448386 RepID=A0A2V3IMI1_9FLOR|nr:Glutathione S-transferase T3 [Gracilariopsis chorda]|eukprot:PXF43283.1 Glutathione S-transferase T3 [Gracilariopsis chorda]
MAASDISKKKIVRGSSFLPAKEEGIAKAWVKVSENSIVGTHQKGDAFYVAVTELYNETFKPANRVKRSVSSIKARCNIIRKECMIFNGCIDLLVRQEITGVSREDIIKMTTAVYNEINMNHVSEECGPPFKHYLAWKLLRNLDKYKCAYENAMAGARGCGTGHGNVRASSPQDSIIKLENGTLSSDETESHEKDA